MLGVGDSIADDAFEEGLENTTGFFVDHWKVSRQGAPVGRKGKEGEGRHTSRNTLDTSTTRKTADGGLGDALDVIAENLAVTLRSAFAEAFATFSACEEC